MAVLSVRDLHVSFGKVEVLRGVSFDLDAGQTLGIAGESGCGKSMTALAIMGMLHRPGVISGGTILLDGNEISHLPEREMRTVRGKQIAMVMQDPFTSLNPMMQVGGQIAEAFQIHQGMGRKEAWDQAVIMLTKVGVPSPERSAMKYPHQMSGGQRQRVVIGIAFACRPKVLLADEPTTALDVTTQAQVLRLLKELQDKHGTAVVLISHDIGAIASVAPKMAIFYAGKIVEFASTEDVLRHPQMPYTRALLNALPRAGMVRLEAIQGQPPDFAAMPEGCAFGPRCPIKFEKCSKEPELLMATQSHLCACWKPG
jgi:oligopeptide/dipeptide ABC transporter ATP-binding protein